MTHVSNGLRVYYLASGAIAIAALRALRQCAGIELVGCGTQPDQPGGRRRHPQPPPVAAWCEGNGIEAERLRSVNSEAALEFLSALRLEMIVVFSFGQILGRSLLNLPRLGCVNIHASLLPRYRGAAPVSAAILGGDRTTGISIVRMVRSLDAGPVFRQVSIDLTGRETAPELERRLGDLAGETIGEAVLGIANGELAPVSQRDADASYAGKVVKQDGYLDWTRPALRLERQVRAYYPWPGAWFVLPGKKRKRLIVTAAALHRSPASAHQPGTVVQADGNGWKVACGEGVFEILQCVPGGKREMTGIEFLRGSPVQPGTVICKDEPDTC